MSPEAPTTPHYNLASRCIRHCLQLPALHLGYSIARMMPPSWRHLHWQQPLSWDQVCGCARCTLQKGFCSKELLLCRKLGYERSFQELTSHPLLVLHSAKCFGGMAENSSFFFFFFGLAEYRSYILLNQPVTHQVRATIIICRDQCQMNM